MTVAGEEFAGQEKADEHDATDDVIEALEDIVDDSCSGPKKNLRHLI
jgi:hypothetical protein